MIEGISALVQPFAEILSPVIEFLLWVFPLKIYRLHDGERGVILTLGKARAWRKHDVGPGITLCYTCELLRKRQVLGLYSDMPTQCLYSKDGYALMANMAAIYEVTDITKVMLCISQLDIMVEGIIMDCAREYARTHKIGDIMLRKDMSIGLIKDCDEELAKWGVKMKELVITDLRPNDIMLIGEMMDRLNKTGFNIRLDSGVRPPNV